jgi:hypothetical protein
MPLSPAAPRKRLHDRIARYQCFARDDGLFDVDAQLTDVKDQDLLLLTGVRRAGDAVHDMWVRVTIDDAMTIVDVEARMDAVPYPSGCQNIEDAYRKLIGANLMQGFRKTLQGAFASVRGCTHLTELLGSVPTAAVQMFAGLKAREDAGEGKPFQLDRCHALDTTGEVVRRYYPKWYRGAA